MTERRNNGTAGKNPVKFKKTEWRNGGKNPSFETESQNGRKTPKTLEGGMTENQPKSTYIYVLLYFIEFMNCKALRAVCISAV